MADAKKMIPFIRKWEGGYVNDPDDAGGCTMMGVTIKVFQKYYGADKTCDDLKHITEDEWLSIFKKGYWDYCKADKIGNQSIAELVVDMAWVSGPVNAIKRVQRALNLKDDGIVGPNTLKALNGEKKAVFEQLWNMRKRWLEDIAQKKNNRKYLKGWLNRLNDIRYED